MNPKVYIFRGAPASGKGTVVPGFAKTLSKPVALLEQDTFRWGFHLAGRGVEDVTQQEHRLAYENMVAVYKNYLESGQYNIVLEGLFTWDDVESSEGSSSELMDIAGQYGIDAISIVLKAEKSELIERNKSRTYVVPDSEFDALYHAVYDTIDPSEIVIDSTDMLPSDVLHNLSRLAK